MINFKIQMMFSLKILVLSFLVAALIPIGMADAAQKDRQERKCSQEKSDQKKQKEERKKSQNPKNSKVEVVSYSCSSVRLAIENIMRSNPGQYPKGVSFLKRLDAIEKSSPVDAVALKQLAREALLSNPLLSFDEILLIRRRDNNLGLPQNWQGNCALQRNVYENQLVVLTNPFSESPELKTLFTPPARRFVGDVDLNFDADRLLFSMLGTHNRWQIWEINRDGSNLRQVTTGEERDVDNYDACYLPSGKIIFDSTRCFAGIPCVGGKNSVANLFVMDSDGKHTRQLCFDQEHDWCPVVLNNGRVMYTRWEYTDTPHYFTRVLMEMNPDGTSQMELYGSNSFWPNSLFYGRPIPGEPSKLVAIVSGHHGDARMGELVIIDPAKGRRDAEGAVQRIPGYGKTVQPIIRDQLVKDVWPRFLHPFPLSAEYFLVSAKLTPKSSWGLYLVDIFDNMTLIHEEDNFAFLEPIPLRPTQRPNVIPEKVDLGQKDAIAFIQDIYVGGGLDGVPRGTVKSLRIFSYHYSYQRFGGHRVVGVESSWDPKRIIGVVPVAEDGSAMFVIPANTPISIQPLDKDGRSLQLMQSWMTAMPGEVLSCVGCHEGQNRSPVSRSTLAVTKQPQAVSPWKGPARGFSFVREVQPVLDRNCVSCHNSQNATEDKNIPDFSNTKKSTGGFTASYLALHPYVRRPGPESDYKLFRPTEYHASTSELIQMLEKGHHGVKLDGDAFERLYTWIDLNAPDIGIWGERYGDRIANQHQRRMAMRKAYAGMDDDPEKLPPMAEKLPVVLPSKLPEQLPDKLDIDNWPLSVQEAKSLQTSQGGLESMQINLDDKTVMEFIRVPAGRFIMGNQDGSLDESPRTVVEIKKPFWMSKTEVTNEQFARFDENHDSRYIDQQHKDHTNPGYPVNKPQQPVVRVSWEQAQSFCNWLSKKSKFICNLPTESQWEWACRAGSESPFSYGNRAANHSIHSNLADQMIKRFAVRGVNPQPMCNPTILDNFIPYDSGINDKYMVTAPVGSYVANVWGLYDMHGNVAEWTRSLYKPYPIRKDDGRNALNVRGRRVVRGGSWRDRPFRATASYRLAYDEWQPVFNVGFRVIIED